MMDIIKIYWCNDLLSVGLLPVPSASGTGLAEFSMRERMREKLKAARVRWIPVKSLNFKIILIAFLNSFPT